MVSALTAVFSAQQYTSILKDTENRLLARKTELAVPFETRATTLNAQRMQLTSARTSANLVSTAVDKSLDKIASMRSLLDDLATITRKYETAAPSMQDYLKTQYTAKLAELTKTADSYTYGGSLTGDMDPLKKVPTEVYYKTETLGDSQSIKSFDLSSDFVIHGSDGNTWVSDSTSSSLTEYSSYPSTRTGKSASLVNGVSLTSFDGTNITVERKLADGSTETITGTLERPGLPVMDTWFYGGLDTAEGRAAAQADIKTAMTELMIGESKLAGNKAQVSSTLNRIDAAMADVADASAKNLDEKANLIAEYQIQSENQFNLILNNLNKAANNQSIAAALLKTGLRSGFSILT